MTTPSPASEPTTAPRYVNYGGEQVFQQPYTARDVSLTAFILPIPEENRHLPQQLLDRVFNTTSGGAVDFRVAMPTVLLTFQHFGDLGSELLPDSAKGGFAYNEATLWLPVTNAAAKGLNLAYFVPYIFADNHYAIAAGREVYGYPKALGSIALPASPEAEQSFSLQTEVIVKFSPEALGQQATLIEVQPGDSPKPSHSIWSKWEHAAEHIGEKLVDKALGFAIGDILHPKVEMVFLKQFRDVADGANACYQSIVQGPGQITGFKSGAPLGDDFQVTINSYDSHPIAHDLGLPATMTAHGFSLDFSFNILPGREIWKITL